MKYRTKLVFIPVILLLLNACDLIPKTIDKKLVAVAYGKNLYMEDLQNIVPSGSSPTDSINIIKRYVNNWVKQQIFLENAKNNLSPEQMNFENKIQNYENSLIIYTFENNLIQKNLDTIIKENQINEYYENNKEEFKLNEHIVKVTYIKVPLDAPDQGTLRSLYRSSNLEALEKLEDYCTQHAATYFINTDTWLFFNEILREMPLRRSNQSAFLKNNRYVEISDNYYRYFLYIHNYKLKGSVSPKSFVTGNIKNILLNQQKKEYINKIRDKFYRDAVKSNHFEIFI